MVGGMASSGQNLPTVRGQIPLQHHTKKFYIIQYALHNPEASASTIAEKANTTVAYVYKVLSQHRRRVSSERWRSDRLSGLGHGLSFYEDAVLPRWVSELKAAIVNPHTGMKQIGFKNRGNLCSAQFHKSGRVIIFPHDLGWETWLVEQLVEAGWDRSWCELLVDNCQQTTKVIEAGIPFPEGSLPKDLMVKTTWGFVLVKDDSPTKNTLEVKLSVPNMERFLGLPEVRKKLELVAQSSLTNKGLLEAMFALISELKRVLENKEVRSVPDDMSVIL